MERGREKKAKMNVNNLSNFFTLIYKTNGPTEKWKSFHATFWSDSNGSGGEKELLIAHTPVRACSPG